jgi:hypothetical protein
MTSALALRGRGKRRHHKAKKTEKKFEGRGNPILEVGEGSRQKKERKALTVRSGRVSGR